MEKTKRKPKNFLKRFMEDYLFFPNDFVFESAKSPEEVIEGLKTLAYEEEQHRFVLKLVEKEKGWQFTLQKEVLNGRTSEYNVEEKLEGEVQGDKMGGTVITGSTFYTILIFVPLLLIAAAAFLYWNFSLNTLSGFIWFIISYSVLLFLMKGKRNHLLELLESVL